ncbi:MAG: fructosamine kinase family protein, partial [Staphylococcus epidermidis]|nr:fructosamine kinase family protein [Staphylococcus epidermidis]
MNEQWMSALPLDNVKDISPISGGDVNEAFKVTTVEEDTFFLLVQRQRSEAFYAAEIAGL